MSYQIKFMFIDGGSIIVSIDEKRVDDFFANLSDNRIFWVDDELQNGFWLPLDKIRYVRLRRENEGSANGEIRESAKQVSKAASGN